MPWDRSKPLLNDEPVFAEIKVAGERASWKEIAAWLSESEGMPIFWETVRTHFDYTLDKVRKGLLEYPEVREWLDDAGLDWRDYK